MPDDPYGSPEAANLFAEDTQEVLTRKNHLHQEFALKSIAISDFVAAAILAVAIVASLALAKLLSALSGLSYQPDAKDMEPYALGLLIIPALLVWAGFSIFRLGLIGRLLNIVLSAALLAGFPIGTFIGAILLFLLLAPFSILCCFFEERRRLALM